MNFSPKLQTHAERMLCLIFVFKILNENKSFHGVNLSQICFMSVVLQNCFQKDLSLYM